MYIYRISMLLIRPLEICIVTLYLRVAALSDKPAEDVPLFSCFVLPCYYYLV